MNMLTGLHHVHEPLRERVRVREENIKAEYTVDMMDVDGLLEEYGALYKDRPVMDVHTFLSIGFADVIPWVEGIEDNQHEMLVFADAQSYFFRRVTQSRS